MGLLAAGMTGARIPIGVDPDPGGLLRTPFTALFVFLPQRAWLDRSVLTVENARSTGRCDLAIASKIRLRWIPPLPGSWPFLVLYAWPAPDGPPVQLAVRGQGWVLVTPGELRMLAGIIGARPGEPDSKLARIPARLRELAGIEERRLTDGPLL
jgi:hypothetical protein